MLKEYVCKSCGKKTEVAAHEKSWQCPECNESNTEVGITVLDLKEMLQDLDDHADIRISDVSEGSDLHVSVGAIIKRGYSIIFVQGDENVWKDETLTPEIPQETLYAAPQNDSIWK